MVNTVSVPTYDEVAILGWGAASTAATGRTVYRKLWAQFADHLTNEFRATHINQTMDRWRWYKARGDLNENVAILVDGSTQTPIKSVKVFGVIEIVSEASADTILAAITDARRWLNELAKPHRISGEYMASTYMYKNQTELVSSLASLQDGGIGNNDFFTIINVAPYAAKQERVRLPNGIYLQVWKKLRKKYGDQLALRFRYFIHDSYKNKEGKPISQPAIQIGQPGAFRSGASKVILKARRDKVRSLK